MNDSTRVGSAGGVNRPMRRRRLVGVVALAVTAVTGIVACDPTPPTTPTTTTAPSSTTTVPSAASSVLQTGQSLATGQQITSPNGQYWAAMQPDGNFAVWGPGGKSAWSTGSHSPNSHVAVQTDGNVAVWSADGAVQWSSGTSTQPNLSLWMQDDGNLVLYTTDHRAVWSSVTGLTGSTVSILGPGQVLNTGQQITSPDGRYWAAMQPDGNFAVWGPGGTSTWSTGSHSPNSHVAMQSDGNLAVWSAAGAVQWSSGTATVSGVLLSMQTDGSLVLYAPSSRALWSSQGGLVTPPTTAPSAHSDAMVTIALKYVGQDGSAACVAAGKGANPGGYAGGECKTFVNCISLMAGGKWPAGGYQIGFANAGFTEVSGAQATRGDVIQIGNSDTASPLHTAIVISSLGGGSYDVVDSNYSNNHIVQHHNYKPAAGARFWRIP